MTIYQIIELCEEFLELSAWDNQSVSGRISKNDASVAKKDELNPYFRLLDVKFYMVNNFLGWEHYAKTNYTYR